MSPSSAALAELNSAPRSLLAAFVFQQTHVGDDLESSIFNSNEMSEIFKPFQKTWALNCFRHAVGPDWQPRPPEEQVAPNQKEPPKK